MKHYRRRKIIAAVHKMYLENLPEPSADYIKTNNFLRNLEVCSTTLELQRIKAGEDLNRSHYSERDQLNLFA